MYVFLALIMMCGCANSKECINNLPQSHTLRTELMASKNETWKKEVMMYQSQLHVTPTDESAWQEMIPKEMFLTQENQRDWSAKYKEMKNADLSKPPVGFLKEVPLGDVRLLEGSIHAQAQKTNLEYLFMLDVDRLIWSFRKTAGLPTPGTPYGGWEKPDQELRTFCWLVLVHSLPFLCSLLVFVSWSLVIVLMNFRLQCERNIAIHDHLNYF